MSKYKENKLKPHGQGILQCQNICGNSPMNGKYIQIYIDLFLEQVGAANPNNS